MALVRIDWKPSAAKLRSFGVSLIVGFAILGALVWFWWQSQTVAIYMWSIGGGIGVLGLTGTVIALPFYWIWMGIALVMGTIVSTLIMTLLYFLLFTPMGLIGRLIGRNKLNLKKQNVDSYWVDLAPPATDPERYERQF